MGPIQRCGMKPDVQKLRPGSRLRVRDWRDGSLVDCTFVGSFVDGSKKWFVLQRDCFMGFRSYLAEDVEEVFDRGDAREASVRLRAILDSSECLACRRHSRNETHNPNCHGLGMIAELDVLDRERFAKSAKWLRDEAEKDPKRAESLLRFARIDEARACSAPASPPRKLGHDYQRDGARCPWPCAACDRAGR